ncbi:ABC transporter permease [Ruminococcaceae bacterium OttesenSCG-928-A16]|nr:ABC transporter permease [Ruminococcaceae bacterium OttesenSCG-928-A16]
MNIFLLEVRNLRRSALTGALSISGVIIVLLAFFPAMQSESMQALAGAKLEGIDEAVLQAVGLSVMFDFSVITNFFGYAIQYVTLAIMVLIVQRAVALLIKEETDGTIEYLCAKPVSRDDIMLQKLLAHLVLVVCTMAVYAVVTVASYLAVSDFTFSQAVKEVSIIFGAMLFVALVFSAIGVLASTLIKSSRGVAGVTVGLVFGTFVLGILSVVIPKLDFLLWLSPMDWVKTEKLMSEGILVQEWIVGFAVIVCGIGAAWLRYRKKDLLI